MNTIKIYDSDGSYALRAYREVIDMILLRLAEAMFCMQRQGIEVQRFSYVQNPKAYYEDPVIADLLESEGIGAFPVTVVDDEIVLQGRYPSNAELAQFAQVREKSLRIENA